MTTESKPDEMAELVARLRQWREDKDNQQAADAIDSLGERLEEANNRAARAEVAIEALQRQLAEARAELLEEETTVCHYFAKLQAAERQLAEARDPTKSAEIIPQLWAEIARLHKEKDRLFNLIIHIREHITRDEDFDADELLADIEGNVDLSEFDRLLMRIEAAERQLSASRAEVTGWRECAMYDAMMGGPVFKGWNRSALDQMRRKAEGEPDALSPPAAETDKTEETGS